MYAGLRYKFIAATGVNKGYLSWRTTSGKIYRRISVKRRGDIAAGRR
jgi:hypothetical protein